MNKELINRFLVERYFIEINPLLRPIHRIIKRKSSVLTKREMLEYLNENRFSE